MRLNDARQPFRLLERVYARLWELGRLEHPSACDDFVFFLWEIDVTLREGLLDFQRSVIEHASVDPTEAESICEGTVRWLDWLRRGAEHVTSGPGRRRLSCLPDADVELIVMADRFLVDTGPLCARLRQWAEAANGAEAEGVQAAPEHDSDPGLGGAGRPAQHGPAAQAETTVAAPALPFGLAEVQLTDAYRELRKSTGEEWQVARSLAARAGYAYEYGRRVLVELARAGRSFESGGRKGYRLIEG